MTVLIEDDPSIRKLVEYSLSSNGISIVSFPSGEEAFESDLKDAELFILDIMLPGMDGMEILSRIRKDPVLGRVPVIMLTAKDSEYDIAKGLDDGADDYRLFYLGEQLKSIENEKLYFPELSHA